MDFRSFVLEWLERRGWSRARLSEAAEISQSLTSKYLAEDERKRVVPGPDSLAKLAPILDVPLEDLMRMCGYLPGEATVSQEENAIEQDVKARMAELMIAVRGTPPWAWASIIRATFDRAIETVNDYGALLEDKPPTVSAPTGSAVRGSGGRRNKGSGGANRPLQPSFRPIMVGG